MSTSISFHPLDETHFSLIHRWFNQLHVQKFYSFRSWTLEEVEKKLTPYLRNEKGIQAFIIYFGKMPFGYIQSCPIKEHPWEDQALSDDIVQEAAGVDLFIGEEALLYQGFGQQIIESFLKEHVWPYYRYCLTDPDIQNEASMRLFQKCGFRKHKEIETLDALKRKAVLQLFIKERPI
jgi:aminoglycoside 6'-N-acetyltransferase